MSWNILKEINFVWTKIYKVWNNVLKLKKKILLIIILINLFIQNIQIKQCLIYINMDLGSKI
jgi:hypothetical protein